MSQSTGKSLGSRLWRTPSGGRGFTLLETLTVIAILCVLASLLFAVYGGAKGKSLVAVSTSNLKQYHHALSLYATDYGAMPVGRPYDPEITRYLGGKWIEPPLAPPLEQRKHKFEGTYMIHAFRDSPGYPKVLRDCFDQRAGSIAIVSDESWTTPQQEAMTKGGFYLYVRMDGSVGTEKGDHLVRYAQHPEAYPCPGAPNWANWR